MKNTVKTFIVSLVFINLQFVNIGYTFGQPIYSWKNSETLWEYNRYQTKRIGLKFNYDTLVTYDKFNNKVGIIVRTFDKRGNVLTELHEGWWGGVWGATQENTFTYDNQNNMLSINSDFYNVVFMYDSKNNLLSEFMTVPFMDGGEKYIYTYDKYGNMLSKERLDITNKVKKTVSKYTYTYDSLNNKLSETWREDRRGGKTIYKYNANNKIILEENFVWVNNAWGENYKISYSYDNNNNKTSCLVQSNKDVLYPPYHPKPNTAGTIEWVTRNKEQYTYNEYNDLLLELKEEFINEKWDTTLYQRFTYEYDPKMNKILEIRVGKNDTLQYSFSYDERNRVKTKIQEHWWTNGNQSIIKENFIFDESGNKLSHIIEKKYGKQELNIYPGYSPVSAFDKVEMAQIRLTYTYTDGMSTSGKCEIFHNNEWQPQQFINHSELKFYFSPQIYESISKCYRFEANAVSFE